VLILIPGKRIIMSQYFLPPNIYVGYRDGSFVFLNLNLDEYILVNGHAAEALLALSSPPDDTRSPPPADAARAALAPLITGGLLTIDATQGKPLRITHPAQPHECLLDSDEAANVAITANDVLNFYIACSMAAFALRFTHLSKIVARIERAKSRHQAHLEEPDLQKSKYLCAKFQKMRYFFPKDYVCLYDSLALIEFLARYQVFPTWVFGIKLEPWGAHCWIQADEYTFNETVEEAVRYTPIMAI
jgi:hypothetical protein